jgi:hypothetical protein
MTAYLSFVTNNAFEQATTTETSYASLPDLASAFKLWSEKLAVSLPIKNSELSKIQAEKVLDSLTAIWFATSYFKLINREADLIGNLLILHKGMTDSPVAYDPPDLGQALTNFLTKLFPESFCNLDWQISPELGLALCHFLNSLHSCPFNAFLLFSLYELLEEEKAVATENTFLQLSLWEESYPVESISIASDYVVLGDVSFEDLKREFDRLLEFYQQKNLSAANPTAPGQAQLSLDLFSSSADGGQLPVIETDIPAQVHKHFRLVASVSGSRKRTLEITLFYLTLEAYYRHISPFKTLPFLELAYA